MKNSNNLKIADFLSKLPQSFPKKFTMPNYRKLPNFNLLSNSYCWIFSPLVFLLCPPVLVVLDNTKQLRIRHQKCIQFSPWAQCFVVCGISSNKEDFKSIEHSLIPSHSSKSMGKSNEHNTIMTLLNLLFAYPNTTREAQSSGSHHHRI